jgi:hypothetical protein
MKDQDRLEIYERMHLRNKTDLAPEEKLKELGKKVRSKWIQLGLNIAIILMIAYAYIIGYRPFKEWLYLLFLIVFLVNVVLLNIQIKQIKFLASHLEEKS